MIEGIPQRQPASPHGTYAMQPRRCTECGSWQIVLDGRYWCKDHHPEYAMKTPTLTAGGKVAPKPKPTPEITPAELIDRWHKLLTHMLTLAVRYGELDALAQKRRAWCDANPFHDLHAERHAAMWLTRQDANETGARMMDACEALSRIQRQLPQNTLDGIGALMGHPLFPMAGQAWAIAAQTIRSTDIFDVGSWVGMRLRAETETQEAA